MSQAILGILGVAEEIDMGDLEYVEGKVVAGDYFQVSGDINALNDTIEFTVPNGKTAFMIEAKITMTTNPTNSIGTTFVSVSDQVVAALKIDSVQKSKAKIGVYSSWRNESVAGEGAGLGYGVNSSSPFNVLGLSLVGDGSKKIEIENVLDNGSGFAEMSGYLIDT